MGNEEDIIIENVRYHHHPGLSVSHHEDGLNFKWEINEKVQAGISKSQKYDEPSSHQFVQSNNFHNQIACDRDNGTDLVSVKCLSTYSNMKEEVDFEGQVKSDTCQEYNEPFHKQYLGLNKSYNQNLNEAGDGNDSVPVEYVQVDHEMKEVEDFKVEIIENFKIEFDSYKESEEALKEQFVEAEENIDNIEIQRVEETEKKCQRKNESIPMFECSICCKQNSSAAKLKLHMFVHLKEAENTCELHSLKICGKHGLKIKILASIKGKEIHLDVFRCRECQFIASNKYYLMYHIKRKHLNGTVNNIFKAEMTSVDLEKREFDCRLCEYKTDRKWNRDSHMNSVHAKDRKFECHLCEYKAKRKADLTKHVSGVHLKEKNFECHLCDYKAIDKSHLDIHVSSVHLNEKKFQCHLCEYKARRKSDLTKHVSCVHLRKKNFECHLCEYKAFQKSNVDNHLSSVHSNDRKFQCHLCEYKATRKSYLNIHLRSVHLKERKYECHLCEYKANNKTHLDYHLSSVHLKERKFQCHLCEYKAKSKSNLAIHLRTVHLKERKFECHLCEYKAFQKSNFESHLSSIHSK